MSKPPEGAQISEDGQYWWDESTKDWQAIAVTEDPAKPEDVTSAEELTPETLAEVQKLQAELDSDSALAELDSLDISSLFKD